MATPLDQLPANIYLNSSFTFNEALGTATVQPATSSTSRFQPFLSNPEKYFCSVGRFSVTGSMIPMLVADIDETQADPNVTTSVVTLYQPSTGKTGTAAVRWVPENTFETVPGAPNGPYGQDTSTTYYYCSTYGAWAEMVTTAFANAQAALLSAGGTLHVPGPAPVLSFNASLGLAQLQCVLENYTDNNSADYPDYIQIWVNGPLAIYFSQFSVNVGSRTGNTAKNTRLRVYNSGSNSSEGTGNNFLTMQMESQQGMAEWTSLTSIAILTDLPILQEQIQPSSNSANPNAVQSQSILIDFVPDLSTVGSYSTSAMIYNASGPSYRQYPILSKSSLSSLNLSIVWFDGLGRQFPVLLRYGSICTLKLVFARIDQFVPRAFQ